MSITRYIAFQLILLFLLIPAFAHAKERKARVTYHIELAAPEGSKNVKVWFPFPASNEHQLVTDLNIETTAEKNGIYADPAYGSNILHAEWKGEGKKRVLTASFTVVRKEISGHSGPHAVAVKDAELNRCKDLSYLDSTEEKVKTLALTITKDKKGEFEKARAVYDWVVENMYRDPSVKGCGLGNVELLLIQKGGKCVDIHAVYVALARAAGIPAREVYGIRIPKGKEGDITKAQHCWAEVYLPEKGWFVVDPADVRKYVLEQNLILAQATFQREYFFGSVDENRIAFGTGKNIMLTPPQTSKPLNYFGYPYAEADGKPLNEDLFGFNLGYSITFKELP